MKRSELGVLVLGLAIGVLLGGVIATWAGVFSSNAYVNGGSNLLGIIGTVPLIGALAVAAWARWHRTCAIPLCLRLGEHPVDGTLQKVCYHHHTLDGHRAVYRAHGATHAVSDRLDRGQSHSTNGAL